MGHADHHRSTDEDIIHVNVYKKRIWGVLKDSLDACFLDSDAVAGAATKFPLGSVFQRGGYLVAMATWTLDSGEGPDDYAVFISSKGEVAVYGGIDPTDATDFTLKGIFFTAPPIGRRCFCKLGADLAVARLRRKESLRSWAQRLGTTVPTLRRLESGDPSISIGIIASALWLIQRDGELGNLASPEHDRGALELDVREAVELGRARALAAAQERLRSSQDKE